MRFNGELHATADVHVNGPGRLVELWTEVERPDLGRMERHLVQFDENHAAALALALQAAVAEIQARAVGR